MKYLAVLILGVLIGASLMKVTTVPVEQTETTHQSWAQKGVELISQGTDPAKQLAEAEKYYGKAVLLFLASLYHHQSQPEIVKVEEVATTLKSEAKKSEVSPPTIDTHAEVAKEASAKIDTKKKKDKTQEGIDRMIAFRKAKLLSKMTPEVRKLNGIFAGTLTNKKAPHKDRIDQVDMEFFLEMQQGKLSGLVKIQLTDPEGRTYSNSTGDGENRTVRLVNNSTNKLYIEPAPGEFIILNVSNPNQMNGDYYDSDGSFKGVVKLWKK